MVQIYQTDFSSRFLGSLSSSRASDEWWFLGCIPEKAPLYAGLVLIFLGLLFVCRTAAAAVHLICLGTLYFLVGTILKKKLIALFYGSVL